jgi:alkylation response protein AidB-like acyl-CoA dehydrogenase
MNLNYSEEQQLLRDSAARFLADRYTFKQRERIATEADGFSEPVWRDFAELGWLALPLSAEYDGLDGGAVDLSILMEAFGRALLLEPYLATITGALTVMALGDHGQRHNWLREVAAGGLRLALGHAEPTSRSNPHRIACQARRLGSGWRLDGVKSLVLGASTAHWLLVSCRIAGELDDESGVGVFAVPAGATGLSLKAYPLIDGQRAAQVELAGVTVDADALLGGCDNALAAVDGVLDRATAALCADAVGVIDALVEATIDHAKTRVQFGKPIGTFQVVQHRIADLAVLREEARSSMLLATLRVDVEGPARAFAVSSAKAKVGRCARHVAQQAVQLHGAMGVTEEMNIGAYLKRVTVFEQLFGSTDFHLLRYATLGCEVGLIEQGLVSIP